MVFGFALIRFSIALSLTFWYILVVLINLSIMKVILHKSIAFFANDEFQFSVVEFCGDL